MEKQRCGTVFRGGEEKGQGRKDFQGARGEWHDNLRAGDQRSQQGIIYRCRGESALEAPLQVFPVGRLRHLLHRLLEPLRRHEAAQVSDFLEAGDLKALAGLDGVDEAGGLQQRSMRARVEPIRATIQDRNPQLLAFQIDLVHVFDLELAALARLKVLGDDNDLVFIKVYPWHCKGNIGLNLLHLDRQRVPDRRA